MVPDKSSPRWKELAAGKKALTTNNLGLQMLLKRVASKTADGNGAEIDKAAGELFDFFTKYEKILATEIAALK